jgi:hypothetical protein
MASLTVLALNSVSVISVHGHRSQHLANEIIGQMLEDKSKPIEI